MHRKWKAVKVFLSIALALMISSHCSAQELSDLDAAAFAYSRGDYTTAFQKYNKLANNGNRMAQVLLGDMYRNGKGVQVDYSQAMRWYRKAADQGNPDAQTQLGKMYNEGLGVPQDYTEAAKWFQRAIDWPEAEFELAFMYQYGHGVPQDYAEAMKRYRKLADIGIAEAQYSLGEMYNLGQGVPPDVVEAAKWYSKAANQGNTFAQHELGIMYYFIRDCVQAYMWLNLSAAQGYKGDAGVRDSVAAKMTPEQLAEAQRLSREWKPKKEK